MTSPTREQLRRFFAGAVLVPEPELLTDALLVLLARCSACVDRTLGEMDRRKAEFGELMNAGATLEEAGIVVNERDRGGTDRQ